MDTPPGLRTVSLPDGGHLAYVTGGPDAASSPPLVFLHGGALDHRMWAEQLATFGATRRVVAVDARGHGWSSTPTDPFRHCEDLAHLLHQLDLAPAALIGLSMGAGTATDTALEHPEVVSHLAVSGTGTSEPEFTDPWVLDILQTWQAAAAGGDAGAWLHAFMRFVHGPLRTMDEVDDKVVARIRQMGERTLATHVPVGGPVLPTQVTDTWERAASIAIPVLAIPGLADSPDHIRFTERLAAMVPDGRLAPVDGAAHYPNMERPATFDAALRAFLDERS